jgi:hypothetical protein
MPATPTSKSGAVPAQRLAVIASDNVTGAALLAAFFFGTALGVW